jgi:Tol biopolymer transport system component
MLKNKVVFATIATLMTITAVQGATGTHRAEHHRHDASTCKSTMRYRGLGTRPGKQAALPFGAGLLSLSETNDRVVAIHPNGRELYFTRLAPPAPQILRSVYANGRWQQPAVAAFSTAGANVEPSISPDGKALYFISTREPSKGTDIWKVDRSGQGWSEPHRLSDTVNSDANEWHPQVTANGDLYFAVENRSDGFGDADLYIAQYREGQYLPAENLGRNINSVAADWDAYVSPDESYLIFKSNRLGGYGGLDMYVSEYKAGSWEPARNIGAAINTDRDEDSGDVTPDGRYLIFSRRRSAAEPWHLYWISASAIAVQR